LGEEKKMGLPIGRGIVESECKWLIHQRFKGVRMRGGEDGFNNLLHLRLAWVNHRSGPTIPSHDLTNYFFPVPLPD